jgi:arabinofuranosyltransferase
MVIFPAFAARERLHRAFVVAAFTYLFLANSWLGDDAYITFRVVWNFLHGYGPVFNPGERVQAYTHPLWMLVLSAAHGITREFFFTALAVSYGLAAVALLRVIRSAPSVAGGAIAGMTLLSSKAFVDYTSSGLEYPLSYLLLFVLCQVLPAGRRTARATALAPSACWPVWPSSPDGQRAALARPGMAAFRARRRVINSSRS